ncbi:hypothetical protein [Allofustis seminis]|uniref:hypothetical protein n=1 Tax=Allofustis seminis TaxID=166939 RepID=UPI0003805A70|nr:hypothetical protein [Allofustis seminis]
MNPIIEKFETAAKERNIVLERSEDTKMVKTYGGKEVELKQVLYRTTLQLGERGYVPASILFQDDDAKTKINYQISYSRVAQVSDRNKLSDILLALNALNASKTGYYNFIVQPDGGISLRHVGLTTIDIESMLETFVFAGKLIGILLKDLENMDGVEVLPVSIKQ